MAVKAPLPGSTINSAFSHPFSEQPISPQPQRPAGLNRNVSDLDENGLLHPHLNHEDGETPSDINPPDSAISRSSIGTEGTEFTELSAIEEPSKPLSLVQNQAGLKLTQLTSRLKSPTDKSPDLKIETRNAKALSLPHLINEPQSVIHIPAGFGTFWPAPAQIPPPPPPQQQQRPSSTSISSQPATARVGSPPPTASPSQSTTNETVPDTSDTMSSNATVIAATPVDPPVPQKPKSPPTLPNIPFSSASDRGTPRASTTAEIAAIDRPASSLASITEGDDSEPNKTADDTTDSLEPLRKASAFLRDSGVEVNALKTALAECWTLCNTLASLSSIHRERIFNVSGKGDMQEQAWKACWKLCQNLYESKYDPPSIDTRPTLDLCREFCSALFEVRVRDNETADSVLRVSFELNNHLFNTHDRSLPEQFRERTLDFYITLCHRLMKQKARMAEETDTLLRSCWSLAEMLFSLRQNKREGRDPDEELLGSAVQACWELCDKFREGWTQIRPERGTPRPSQTTFTQAFNQASRIVDHNSATESGLRRFHPETPTTIFEDTFSAHVMSPDEVAPFPSIALANEQPRSLGPQQRYPQYANSTGNHNNNKPSTSALSMDSPMSATTFATDSSVASSTAEVAHQPVRGRDPAPLLNYARSTHSGANITVQRSFPYAPSARSASATPSEAGVSEANTARTTTTRTTDTVTRQSYADSREDYTLTLLKTLFVRAALQSGRGYNPISLDKNQSDLQSFAKSLPEDAFGSLSWQTSLLDNFKKAIANDPGFQNISQSLHRTNGGTPLQVAKAVQRMVKGVYGFGWLRDLFRYVYGVYMEEVLQGVQPVNNPQLSPFHRRSTGPASVDGSGTRKAGFRMGLRRGVRSGSLAERLADQAANQSQSRALKPIAVGESVSAGIQLSAEPSSDSGALTESEESI